MTETDGALARAASRGGRSAFAELYDRRARLIRAFCFDTTNDLHSAADLTQEVFLRAYSKVTPCANQSVLPRGWPALRYLIEE